MKQEIIIGIVLGVSLFLIYIGLSINYFLILIFALTVFYLVFNKKGLVKNAFFTQSPSSGEVLFSDVGGQWSAKKELIEAMDFIQETGKISHMGIRPLKGILLTGPPGTGKTMLAKAAATYTDAVFLATSGSEFVEMYAGVGAKRVRDLFNNAKKLAVRERKFKAILFIDEIEVLGAKRGTHTNHMEYDQTLNQLLVEMDGLQSNYEGQLLVIAATNRADMIDPALLRPGRFDRIVQVDLPDKEARLKILELHTKNKPMDKDVELDIIAQDTFGFSGAHLESLANEAAILALRENQDKIKQRHFGEAIDKVMLGEKIDRKPQESELQRVAVHETGHALLSELERPGSVAHVTIVPRGQAMGYIRQSPQNDYYLQTKSQIESQIRIALAGSLAEEIMFQERSTGARGDIKEAVKLAKHLITCGLSDVGIIDSEHASDLMGETVRRIIVCQEHKVKEILKAHGTLMEEIASTLRQEEYLSGDDLRSFLNHYRRAV